MHETVKYQELQNNAYINITKNNRKRLPMAKPSVRLLAEPLKMKAVCSTNNLSQTKAHYLNIRVMEVR